MMPTLAVVDLQKYTRVAVVGDLHGDFKTMQAILGMVDLKADLLVFLGDYADRGPDGVEVIRTVAGLREQCPKNVLPLMGNHEDFSDEGEPKFYPSTIAEEADRKVGSWDTFFRREFKPLIDGLFLAALVPNNALLVHGGVSSKLRGIDDLAAPSEGLRLDLLWSDPFDGKGEQPNLKRGLGTEFGADISASVCKSLGIERIIRSHEPQKAMTRPAFDHAGRVVTVQATTVYGGVPFIYFVDPTSSKKDYYKSPLNH